MHEEVKSRLLELIRTAVETGELQTNEHELELPDGVNSYEARIVKSGADEAVCIVRDITERKQAEEALRQQKELLQTIFDHIPVMVAFYDVTGQIQLLNREVERVLGWSIAELQDRDLLSECYPDPEYRQKVFDFMLASAGKWQDFKTKTRYGRTLDTSWANIQLSDGKSIGIGQDISDRKQAEEARRKAEQRYHSIFENSDKGLFQMTPDGRYVSANPALARIYGYSSPEELMASLTNINQQLYLDSNRRAQFLARMQADDRVSDFEAQIYRKDGNIIWILENAHVVRDAQGELLYYEGSVVDVTERKVWEEALRYQQECTEQLLLNILPSPIAERLKRAESIIADSFANVTVLFADLVDFTEFSAQIPPTKLLDLLNKIFSKFDQLSEKHGLEKIKTIGDAYMVVGGLPTPKTDHAEAIAEMALEMQREIDRFRRLDGQPMSLRIGIHSGPVVAGVIGMKKFAYDLWGDTVNVASRMESLGVAGRIQVTAETYELLKDKYCVEKRGAIFVKGKGEMITYWLTGRKICNLNTSYEVKDEV
jgi:urea transport system substrate-binding protein